MATNRPGRRGGRSTSNKATDPPPSQNQKTTVAAKKQLEAERNARLPAEKNVQGVHAISRAFLIFQKDEGKTVVVQDPQDNSTFSIIEGEFLVSQTQLSPEELRELFPRYKKK